MDGADHCRLHGIGPVVRNDQEARSPIPCTVVSRDGEALLQRAAHCTTTPDARTHARTRARTHAHPRSTTNDATCGPPAWLTGRLQERGIRSVRSPLRRPPSLRPLSPCPCKAAAPKGPAFCFLNYPLNPPDTDRLIHTPHTCTPTSGCLIERAYLPAVPKGPVFCFLNYLPNTRIWDAYLGVTVNLGCIWACIWFIS